MSALLQAPDFRRAPVRTEDANDERYPRAMPADRSFQSAKAFPTGREFRAGGELCPSGRSSAAGKRFRGFHTTQFAARTADRDRICRCGFPCHRSMVVAARLGCAYAPVSRSFSMREEFSPENAVHECAGRRSPEPINVFAPNGANRQPRREETSRRRRRARRDHHIAQFRVSKTHRPPAVSPTA
jgi:hypothetical protein